MSYLFNDDDDDDNSFVLGRKHKSKKDTTKPTSQLTGGAVKRTATVMESSGTTSELVSQPSSSAPTVSEPVVFLTKKQREAQRLQREAEEAAELLSRHKEEVNAITKLESLESRNNLPSASSIHKSRHEQNPNQKTQRQSQNYPPNRHSTHTSHTNPSYPSQGKTSSEMTGSRPANETDVEKLNTIVREQYLNQSLTVSTSRLAAGESKPTVKGATDKFKLQWDVSEDTTTQAKSMPNSVSFGTLLGARADPMANDSALLQPRKSRSDVVVRHWKDKDLSEMTYKDWRTLREDFNISVRNQNCPNPLRFWSESNLPHQLLHRLDEVGFSEPSPIQRATIPIGLQRTDVLGIAQTGSGKTLAFLFPMFAFLNNLPRLNNDTATNGPYAIVLGPTRVLVEQIHQEAMRFGECLGLRSVAVIGGRSLEQQAFALGNGAELICATPDRLFDLIDKRLLVLSQCNYIVLDEADRMLDMGFEPKIIQVMDALPSSNIKPISHISEGLAPSQVSYRQTVMFSATMPPKVESLALKYLRNPIRIEINTGTRVADTVQQVIEWVSPEQKNQQLLRILEKYTSGPIIIFCNRKVQADELMRFLEGNRSRLRHHRATAYHTGKTQDQRDAALEGFKNDAFSILVATDVAARGLDVKGIKLVVNFTMPEGEHPIQTYTHRIGRTGRAGSKGVAISLVSELDAHIFYSLRRLLEESEVKVPKQLHDHPASKIDPRILQKGTDLSKVTNDLL